MPRLASLLLITFVNKICLKIAIIFFGSYGDVINCQRLTFCNYADFYMSSSFTIDALPQTFENSDFDILYLFIRILARKRPAS